MRLLLHNPNTNRGLTDQLAAKLRPHLHDGETLAVSTADAGPPFIGSDATIADARARLVAALRPRAGDCDAILLGCFGDLGLDEIRRSFAVPIVSLWDTCFATAALWPRQTALITTSPFWATRLRDDVARHNLQRQIVEVIAISADPPAPKALADAAAAAIAEIAQRDAADAIVLGGAVLAVLHQELARLTALPVIDGLAATVSLCRALAA
jgi:allantoin racemase